MNRSGVSIVAIVLALIAGQVWAWNTDAPDEPAAQSAAREALQALGPGGGGLPVAGEVRTLQGLAGGGLAVTGQAEQLQRAIKDLGAQVKEVEIRVDLSGDILFDFDKTDLKPAAEETLSKLAQIIRAKRTGRVRIQGHTDAKGNDEYNQRLSKRRADAVKQWLAAKGGIPPAVMEARGFGKTRPVAPNTKPDGSDNPEGRAKNRRVEVVIETGPRSSR